MRGSLSEGVTMKLDAQVSVEAMRAGKFVVIDGETQTFFCMVTDVELAATDQRILANPPISDNGADTFLRRILAGVGTFANVTLRPMLMLEKNEAALARVAQDELRPVKTIPSHFRPSFEASEADVARIFGSEDEAIAGDAKTAAKFFHLGQPLDMDTPVCLNLDRFVERSSGIFGKSGTGKTFLTRICLCGILRSKKAVTLIFDMHSEYGWYGTHEGASSGKTNGLKHFFRSDVEIFTLDPASSRRRGVRPDFAVRIPYSQVSPEDILLLAGELNLTATSAETTYLLNAAFGDNWLAAFLDMDGTGLSDFAEQHNGNVNALSALQRRLKMMAKTCEGFLVRSLPPEDDAVRAILNRLDRGVSVVLEFGQEDKTLSYMLVANILTRRIHASYVRKKEEAQGGVTDSDKKPLVIAIEEAHKFLSPQLVGQTIFGTIARELRKYDVTLLIIDQRPSGIDDEVLSQIGTRMTCLLNDDKDIDAVLTGVSGSKELRAVLASLDSKQQALVLGHAVPMPVVIKIRTYDDEEFRRAMGSFNKTLPLPGGAVPALSSLVNGDVNGDKDADAVKAAREAEEAAARVRRTMELDFA